MLNEMQTELLKMLSWLDKFCRLNSITYYAVGGTMLGAARHKGFIPWDDDIDIGVPRNDYERLIALLKKPINGYIIESPKNTDNPDFLYCFAKFYDTNTTMTEYLKKSITRGVYIDIFPIDGIGNTLEESHKNITKILKKRAFLVARVTRIRKSRKFYKNLYIFICHMIPNFIVNERKLCSKIDLMCSDIKYETSRFVGNLMGAYGKKEIIEKEIFGEPKEYQFENIKIYGPEKPDEFLKHIYGNWTELPPEEKRHSAHDFTNLSFRESYLNNEKR